MAQRWSWSTTGYNFTGRPLDEVIETCAKAGLVGIEGAQEVFPTQTLPELRQIASRFAAAGLRIDTYHLPFPAELDIASFYETTRRHAAAEMLVHLERAAALGARAAIQHPTTTRHDVETEGLERYLEAMGRSLDTLLPRCAELGITLAVENMLPGALGAPGQTGHRFGSRPEHLDLMAARWPHPSLGFCLDTGHALVAGGPEGAPALFAAMAPRLAAFHLADNAGDRDSHLAPGHGLVDWRTFFRQAARLGFAHPLCIETPPFAPGPSGLYPLAAWKEMVLEIEGLAAEATATGP
ncbi:MAG: sugar phosphate isomerase/epimerase family protein [Candidatus Latescibacterota bacterium]